MTATNPTRAAANIERQRIISIIDARIASWEQFQHDYPDHLDADIVIAELDYIRRRVDASIPKEETET